MKMGRYYGLCLVVLMMSSTVDSQVLPTTRPATRVTPPTTITPPPPTTTKRPPSQRGVVFTMKKQYYQTSGAQIRSIPVIPYYDDWDEMLPGIKFGNDQIHFLSADVDWTSQSLFMYDYHLKAIAIGNGFNTDLDLSGMSFEFMHEGVSESTVQVAQDWLSHMLYWVDPGFGWIAAAPGNSSRIPEDLYTIIVRDLEKPDGITLDPLASLLFWSDNGRDPKIERSTLTGENRLTIVTRSLKSPRTLEADHLTQRLFWIDHASEEIESVSYTGTDRRLIRRIAQSTLFDLAIYKELMITTDISDGSVYFFNKTTGDVLRRTIRIGSEIAYGVAIYTSDNQPTKTTDHCTNLACPHMCITQENGAKCVCTEGFQYIEANNSCIEKGGSFHRAYILATYTDICYGDIRNVAKYTHNATCVYSSLLPEVANTQHTTTPSNQPPPTTRNPTTTTEQTIDYSEEIKFLELDMEKRILYFAGPTNIYSRPIDDLDYANRKTGVTATNLIISGLAFDWIDGANLYYSTENGFIYVKNVQDTSLRRVAVTDGVVSNLILMPHERQLAWVVTDPSRRTSRIESWYIGDTSDAIKVGIDDREEIKSLCYDQHSKKFYWIENYNVYMYMPGGIPTSITNYSPSTPLQVLVYKDTLIVSKMLDGVTSFEHFNTAGGYRVVNTGSFQNLPTVQTFKILDLELQPYEPNPCKDNFGGCSQICLTTHNGNGGKDVVCDCSYGFTLQSDRKSCKSAAKYGNHFLLVTDWTHDQINMVDLVTQEFFAIDIEVTGKPTAILYNPITELLMFALSDDDYIYSARLDGQVADVFVELNWFVYPNRFALDETTGNMYYTSTYNYIGIITPRQTYLELEMRALVFEDVRAIALHPGKGYMYYTVQSVSSYIGRSFMDGDGHQMLIQNSSTSLMMWPNGLAIDYKNGHLYWSDKYYDTVTQCDLDGNNCVLFVEDKGADISDIKTDGVYLYITGFNRGIIRVKLDDPERKIETFGNSDEPGRLDTLDIYVKDTPNVQPAADKCNFNDGKGDCSTICLPKPYGHTCACDYNRDLKADGKTCTDVYQCSDKIDNVEVPSSCSRYVGSWCEFVCEDGYKMATPTINMTFQCTSLDWDYLWAIPDLCTENKCPMGVDNVIFGSTCNGSIGSTCSYVCQSGYTPKQSPATATCLPGGTWNIENNFCQEMTCPVNNTITNGKFLASCTGVTNVVCTFQCDRFFAPSLSPPQMKCLETGMWNENVFTACVAVMCPETVDNGVLGTCGRTVGSSCPVTCNKNYVNTVDEVVCTESSKWSPKNACKHSKPQEKPPPSGITGGQIAGIIIGVILIALIVLVIIAMIVLYKRRMLPGMYGSGPSAKYSSSDIAIENPGYMNATINVSDDTRNESPYDNANGFQPVGFNYAPEPQDNGYTNPMYVGRAAANQEPMPEQSDIGITHEDVVLTTDSWQKEQLKGPDACNKDNHKSLDEFEFKVEPNSDCAVQPCTLTLNHVIFANSCTGTVDETCSYGCVENYEPVESTATAICLLGGAWNRGTDEFCKKKVCTGTFTNGILDTSCSKTVGSSCRVTCNENFVNIVDEVACLDDGTWSLDVVCKRTPCAKIIKNGAFDMTCTGEYGSACEFTCNIPYYKSSITVSSLTCDIAGKWMVRQQSVSMDKLCEEILCMDGIRNGVVDNTCANKVFSNCDFACNSGFIKNIGVTRATCSVNGTWSTNDVTACVPACTGQFRCNDGQCIPLDKVCDKVVDCTDKSDEGDVCVTCPKNIPNGALIACDIKIGSSCDFRCNSNYSKAIEKVICLASRNWHTNPCQVTTCPKVVENGRISLECNSLTVGNQCAVVCNTNFQQIYTKKVECLTTGQWDVSKGICKAIEGKPELQTFSVGQLVGIILGVIVFLIVIVVVVMFVILYKRRLLPGKMASSPKATYSTSDIAIENPGYMTANISVADDTRNDNPYDNPKEMQPVSSYGNGTDTSGYVNPMYKTNLTYDNREPLPEQSDIDVDLDSVVLTHDSWQKEQLKGTDA